MLGMHTIAREYIPLYHIATKSEAIFSDGRVVADHECSVKEQVVPAGQL